METRKLGFTAPHFFYKFQSDRWIRKTEDWNFSGVKSKTQWWYYDAVLADGSVLIFMFTPVQWWSENSNDASNQALACVSLLSTDGNVVTTKEGFDANSVKYSEYKIQCKAFTIERKHGRNNRHYTIELNLPRAKGSVVIDSFTKAFSPFPGGVVNTFVSKHLLKLKGEKPLFRYAAHVPHGEARCDLQIDDQLVRQAGKAYHEQGMFRGLPEYLGKGWAWIHFVSNTFNIFGKPQDFVCLEKNGKKTISGTTFFDRGVVLSDVVYDMEEKNLIVSGALSFRSNKLEFTVTPSATGIPLIVIPSAETEQLWGTVAQRSTLRYKQDGGAVEEQGWLLIETCKMGRYSVSP